MVTQAVTDMEGLILERRIFNFFVLLHFVQVNRLVLL